MNYKSIVLATLLLPASCLGTSLEQLEETQNQLLLEVKEAQAIIFPNENYIKEGYRKYRKQLGISFERKRKEIPNATDREIETLILKKNASLYNEFLDILKEESFELSLLNAFLDTFADRLFDIADETIRDTFYDNKIRETSGLIEDIVMVLVKVRYLELIQELIIINNNITRLEQKPNHILNDIIATALLIMPRYVDDPIGAKAAVKKFNKAVEEKIISVSARLQEKMLIDEAAAEEMAEKILIVVADLSYNFFCGAFAGARDAVKDGIRIAAPWIASGSAAVLGGSYFLYRYKYSYISTVQKQMAEAQHRITEAKYSFLTCLNTNAHGKMNKRGYPAACKKYAFAYALLAGSDQAQEKIDTFKRYSPESLS